ncbi:Cytochrome b5- protein, partial [Gonapodya sp. JEL0774]
DLTSFQHPGGAQWLELTAGMDITEAFEAHHPNVSVIRDRILPKYYVREATWPRESPITFAETDFYSVLRSRVRDQIRTIGSAPRRWSKFYADGTAATYLALLGATAYVGFGSELTKLTALSALPPWLVRMVSATVPAALVVLGGTAGGMLMAMAHNFAHQKDNFRMYYHEVAGASYKNVRIHHVLSHHLYPNSSLDVEYPLFQPLYFWPE